MMPAKSFLSRRQALAGLVAGASTGPWTLAPATAQSSAPAGDDKAAPLPKVGTRLELPEVPLLDGSTFRPAQVQGQVLVIYWWASWCPFCAVQSPLMDKLWREQRGRGLKMLALSIDRKPEDASAYLARRGYQFPSGHVTPAVAQALPKPRGLPVTLVRGRDGKVLLAEAGQMFPEDVEAIADFL
jgi:thiol-disulfide isomerase/thioredoxin